MVDTSSGRNRAATTGASKKKSSGGSFADQLGLGATEQGKRGGLGGILNFFSSRNTGSDPAAVAGRKAEDDRVAAATTKIRQQSAGHKTRGIRGGYVAGGADNVVSPPTDVPAAPSGPRKPKTVKKAAVITSTPSATAGSAKTVSPNTGVQSWHVGGNVPNKRLIDPGTQMAATSRQIKPRAQAHAGLKAQGAKHSTKGLRWFNSKD